MVSDHQSPRHPSERQGDPADRIPMPDPGQKQTPRILHLGDPIKYNHEVYEREFSRRFEVVRVNELLSVPDSGSGSGSGSGEEGGRGGDKVGRFRERFMEALRQGIFGNFSAIFRPHFQTGGEMGRWDEELISLLPSSVKIFASAGAGYNWADVDALGRKGIYYTNGAGCSDDAVSDTTIYMILSVFRNFTRQIVAARTGDPEVFMKTHRLIGEISRNPRGKVLGVIGLGSISKKVARKAGERGALGMKVHYFDVLRQPQDVERELGVVYENSLEDLLRMADCVTIHTPLNQHTKHMINETTIGQMKDGARLVNTSRGEVVEEEALVQALESGKLSAAGLDVHYHEPQVNVKLARMDNVTLTTHNGGGALETRVAFELNSMRNILAVVGSDGEIAGDPLTPVNAKVVESTLKKG